MRRYRPMIPALRSYQSENLAAINEARRAGHRNVLYVLPTGGGKSVVVSTDVAQADGLGMAQCVVAHRQELVGQMSLHVARAGIRHRVIGPNNVISSIIGEHRRELGRSFIDPNARAAVAGVDTLVSRKADLAGWGAQIGRWTVDEAHHVLRENKWGVVAELFPNAWGLGVTASPRRADGQGLGRHADGLFDTMVVGPTMRELIDMGSLCDYQICVPETDFDRDALKVGDSGDFSPKAMRDASEHSHIVGDVLTHYCRYSLGKRAIVFATDVETSNKMAAQFNAVGIPAASVSAKTEDSLRQEYIRRFRAGSIMVLVNVDLFGEGFDLPSVATVIMARPTASLAVYLQQFGRALRLLEGKKFGLIIDMVSNWKQHGFPDKHHNWSLDRRDKRGKQKPDPEEIPLQRCSNLECMKPFERVYRSCPHCGTPVPLPVGGSVRDLKQVDGDLMLLDTDILARMRSEIELESAASVGNRVGHVAGGGIGQFKLNQQHEKIMAQRELQATLDLWAGHRAAKGEQAEQIYRRFYLATGKSVLDVQHKDLTTSDYNTTTAMIKEWMQ
jgi:DNA repair protein RadD